MKLAGRVTFRRVGGYAGPRFGSAARIAVIETHTLPDPVFRQKNKTVANIEDAVQTLIDDMIRTMRAVLGLELAAPQTCGQETPRLAWIIG